MNKKTIALVGIFICVPLGAFAIISKTRLVSSANKSASTGPADSRRILKEVGIQDPITTYQEKLSKIKSAKERKDLDALIKVADEIETQRPTLGVPYYTDLMVEAVGAMSGYGFGDSRQHVFAIKYAKAALENADQLPIEGEIRLVGFLEGGPEYDTGEMKPEQWAQDRRERVQYWLHAWRRLDKTINRNFDFNNRPTLSVLPPPGYGPAGIAPESIKDPVVRAHYKQALQRNQEKIDEYNRQWQLRQLDKFFEPNARRFLVQAYSKEPYDFQELSKYMETYGVDSKTREAVTSEVSRRISVAP